jgi:hypothetical protein
VHAGAGSIEPTIEIGAADLTLDALTDRQIGAEMRAPGTCTTVRPDPSRYETTRVPRKIDAHVFVTKDGMIYESELSQ